MRSWHRAFGWDDLLLCDIVISLRGDCTYQLKRIDPCRKTTGRHCLCGSDLLGTFVTFWSRTWECQLFSATCDWLSESCHVYNHCRIRKRKCLLDSQPLAIGLYGVFAVHGSDRLLRIDPCRKTTGRNCLCGLTSEHSQGFDTSSKENARSWAGNASFSDYLRLALKLLIIAEFARKLMYSHLRL